MNAYLLNSFLVALFAADVAVVVAGASEIAEAANVPVDISLDGQDTGGSDEKIDEFHDCLMLVADGRWIGIRLFLRMGFLFLVRVEDGRGAHLYTFSRSSCWCPS